MNLRFRHLLFSLLCGLVACTTSLGSETPTEIRDAQLVGELFVEPRHEQVQTNNCDGQSKFTTLERSLSQGQTTFFEVEVGVSGLVKGSVIPDTIEAQLEAKVQAALGRILSNTYQQKVSIQLETQPGTASMHTVTWNETKTRGFIEVVYPSGIGRIGFEKIVALELSARTSEALPCGSSVQESTTSEPPTLSPVTPTAINIEATATNARSPTVPADTAVPANTVTQTDVDALFGSGNWFCFPDREDALGVNKLPTGLTVSGPLSKIDTGIDTYETGETPSGVGATAWLNQSLAYDILCPQYQQEALKAWASERTSDIRQLDRARMDELFGSGNWQCLSAFAYAAKITNFSTAIEVKYPLTALDDPFGKHGVGEIVQPSGEATAWLVDAIPRDQCP